MELAEFTIDLSFGTTSRACSRSWKQRPRHADCFSFSCGTSFRLAEDPLSSLQVLGRRNENGIRRTRQPGRPSPLPRQLLPIELCLALFRGFIPLGSHREGPPAGLGFNGPARRGRASVAGDPNLGPHASLSLPDLRRDEGRVPGAAPARIQRRPRHRASGAEKLFQTGRPGPRPL